MQFDYTPLVVKQNNHKSKTVNVYIVYDLDYWPKAPLRNLTLKNCLFGATNIVKNSDRQNYVYSGCGIAFDGKRSWGFNDDFATNVIIFGVDNSSSSHTDNLKNGLLMLGEGDTFGINGSFGAPKKISINFTKAKRKLCFSLHYNADKSYLFVNGKKIHKFKASNKNNNFPSRFCLGSISNEFDRDDLNEVSLKGNLYDFSVDYSAIDKRNILNIHKYLIIKNDI